MLQGTGPTPEWAAPLPGEAICLHQDTTVCVSQADPGVVQEIELGPGRQAYIVCIEGSLEVGSPSGGAELGKREGVEVVAVAAVAGAGAGAGLPLRLAAGSQGAHFMVLEMKGAA